MADTYGSRLKACRRALGLTQTEVPLAPVVSPGEQP